MHPEYIARCAQLALLLEVSATPKPGNVDRNHDHGDTRYEHFLASAVGVYPVFKRASRRRKGVGKLIRNAVKESTSWQRGGNTHFGAFLLLIPLSMAAGMSGNHSEIRVNAMKIMEGTTVEDAIELYRAFSIA
ncbi:MAG: triphosphoribosyl-dephospho-CoA synthase, partial [Candidatus Syntropharchaeia archaeon]